MGLATGWREAHTAGIKELVQATQKWHQESRVAATEYPGCPFGGFLGSGCPLQPSGEFLKANTRTRVGAPLSDFLLSLVQVDPGKVCFLIS